MLCHIGNSDTDRAKAYDSQLLAFEFRSCEVFLGFLRILPDILVTLVLFHPLNAAHNIT